MPVAGAPVFRPQPPQTPPRPPQDPDFMNGGHTLDQHGLPEGSSTSPGVLYAVLTLLGELDVNALKVIKSDVSTTVGLYFLRLMPVDQKILNCTDDFLEIYYADNKKHPHGFWVSSPALMTGLPLLQACFFN